MRLHGVVLTSTEKFYRLFVMHIVFNLYICLLVFHHFVGLLFIANFYDVTEYKHYTQRIFNYFNLALISVS
jgi:hypothetical protein